MAPIQHPVNGIYGDWALGEAWKTGGDANWRVIDARLVKAWSTDLTTTTGLTYGYNGGACVNSTGIVTIVAGGTTGLTDNTTNYVERTVAGVVSVGTGDFDPTKLPMAIVVTSGGAITSITDHRIFASRLHEHEAEHESGGTQEINVDGLSGELADPQPVQVYYDGGSVGVQPGINFSGDLFTSVVDNPGQNRVDVTVDAPNALKEYGLGFVFGDGVNTPSNGCRVAIPCPWDGTIVGWYARLENVSGSAQFSVHKATTINGTLAHVGGTQPSVTSDLGSSDNTLDWSLTSVAAGHAVRVTLESLTTANQATLVVVIRRTL